MPALRKPHRIAFLLPDVTIQGPESVHAHEAALLLWLACIETCQRHPGLAVYDAESTPLAPHDGHFRPPHAMIGASPTDPFFATTRRDELVWLEVALPRAGAVRLHTIARDGGRQVVEGDGESLGEQIQHALSAWLARRGLPALPRRFEPIASEELLAAVRAIGPPLVEQASAWALPVSTLPPWAIESQIEDPSEDPSEGPSAGPGSDDAMAAAPRVARAPTPGYAARLARTIAARVPAALQVPALRLVQLALGENTSELILARDPAQPQALFARFLAGPVRDFALLRQVIAAAPCWARPYGELVRRDVAAVEAPRALESVAGAGIAALCRPGHLDVIETVAALLADAGLGDEGVRLLERALAIHDGAPRAHLALLERLAVSGRDGALCAQARRSARAHGCPLDDERPWYPDQIRIELFATEALARIGRLDEAIALRARRLAGREASWSRQVEVLERWRRDPALRARCQAREAALRGDPARTVEGFARAAPERDEELAALLDAMVALGREDAVLLAWAHHGRGRGLAGPCSRLAAARALCVAGEWRRGLEELWRVELTEPGRDEHVAIARIGRLLACAPLAVAEAALGERVAIGASSLARRMARDVADFVPDAARSSVVARALGKRTAIDLDLATLERFPRDTPSRAAIDALFAELGALTAPTAPTTPTTPTAPTEDAALARADLLVERWLEAVYAEASEDEPAALARAAAYAAAQALGRYLAATTAPASPIAGALRTVAGEALALVRAHRAALGDVEVRALLGVVDPLLRRVDRWVGSAWLATVERSCGIDERAGGDLAGFAREHATAAARLLGPEETAVLAASVARLHRERPERWAAAVYVQGAQLALHTGCLGADEWADAIVAQLAARELDLDDAIDALHTACYLVEGKSAGPCVHAAEVLLDAGRGPAAMAVLSAGLGAAEPAWRDRQLAALAPAWARLPLDVPLSFEPLIEATQQALARGELPRAEKLARLAVAIEPTDREARRRLGVALAQQGKAADALEHLVRDAPDDAPQLLADTLAASGQAAELGAVRADEVPTEEGPSAREPAFALLESGELARAEALLGDASWRVQRAALVASRARTVADREVAVPARALAAAGQVLSRSVGATDLDATVARTLALEIRAQAHFAREPVPPLGTSAAAAPEPTAFVDRVVVPGSRVERISDYVALLRDLALLGPGEALAQFDLDEATYLEVGAAWGAAIDADPELARTIEAGLARR